MEIVTDQEKFKNQIIDLILHIQNDEANLHLSLEEQPDLPNIPSYYGDGGAFFVAVDGEAVIGTAALMNYHHGNGVFKKFFVKKEYRRKGIGTMLYTALLAFAKQEHYHTVILDTPSVAKASHRFYEKAGFQKIDKNALPFPYQYPDRQSVIYLLHL
ncbi:MAG: GNAT family N-acetyltransferase [Eubacterium sp.]|nr:GNAT family N-acetyltransferase [Eubacterium sp.]